jgi:hypothetical protein
MKINMRLSDLLKRLYKESDFTSVVSLSDKSEIGKGFIDRAFAGKPAYTQFARLGQIGVYAMLADGTGY